MASVSAAQLRELETEAYLAVLRAFFSGPPDWDKDGALSMLRKQLHIDNDLHLSLSTRAKEDLKTMK
jgi:hypothetical protein